MGFIQRGPQQDDGDDFSSDEAGEPVEPDEPHEKRRAAKPVTPATNPFASPPPRSGSVDPLLDEVEPLSDADDDGDDDEIVDALIDEVVVDGEIEYELDAWASESRQMLSQLLTAAEVAFVWQGGTLVVAAADERQVDQLVDHVETVTLPTLDPAAEKISYEIDDLSDFQQDHLFDLLEGQEIAFELDAAGELVVLADDEEAVDTIMEAIDFPGAIPAGEDDEEADQLDRSGIPVAADLLSDLFVAVDRLQHKATDPKGVLGVVEAAGHFPKLRVPYGFDAVLWERIGGELAAIHEMLEEDDATDEDIEELARNLRMMLHTVV